jgi:hypothetical protein
MTLIVASERTHRLMKRGAEGRCALREAARF